jgi:hypothetical protein
MNDNQTFKSPLWEVQTGRIPSVISVAQLTNKIKQDTMARDFALGYAVILTEALQQIETEERGAGAELGSIRTTQLSPASPPITVSLNASVR